ncbi:hypothetical protein KPH14_001594 [Odynerus spinipes]|uniref:NADH dehydrogenase [ubiquinone] 1 alpha subcomplex subunit 1 n=1 Tax=Odynerus spinipes TaxID=1348599 RepID=A0AAD9RZM8_9HYME|nr:hypothetical protein KPH14_001594 [Odynerus spinipes]
MWYEILPTVAIIMAGVGLPNVMIYINQFAFGNPLRRTLEDPWNRRMFHRDTCLTDNPWAASAQGLKNIPDE